MQLHPDLATAQLAAHQSDLRRRAQQWRMLPGRDRRVRSDPRARGSGPPQYEQRRWIALILLCFAQFIVILDGTIVNIALPSIGVGGPSV